jgi:hypothetical protein
MEEKMRVNRWTLINALQVAMAQYREDAESTRRLPQNDGRDSLVESFNKQAREAKEMAEAFEQEDVILLEDS